MFSLIEKWRESHAEAVLEKRSLRIEALQEMLRLVSDVEDFPILSKMYIIFSDDLGGNNAVYRGGRSIALSTSSVSLLQPLFVAHEARHAGQARRGLSSNRMLNIMDAIVNQRFAEADCYSLEAELAWKFEQHDAFKGIWARYKKEEKSIAKAFESAMQTGSIKDARLAAFNEWFRSGYKDSYDADTIDDCQRQCENVARGKRAYVSTDKKRPEGAPERMSEAYLREFGVQGDGGNYLEKTNTQHDFYTGRIAKFNQRRIERLARQYSCIKTATILPQQKMTL